MRKSQDRKAAPRLARLEQRFALWRRTRNRGDRIPGALWRSAAKVAADFGVNVTAKRLHLDYYTLKEHVDRLGAESSSTSPFVEIPSAPTAHASECVIELDDGMGASMRVHLKGAEVPDVLALGRSFWEGQ